MAADMRVEGRNAVLEALRAGFPFSRIYIADGLKQDRAIEEISRLASAGGTAPTHVPRRKLDELSERGAHQGVIGEARPFSYARLDRVMADSAGVDAALVIALDHITDPGNLGAVVRTAEVVGAAGVIVPSRRSAPVTAAAWKAAAGAFAHVPVVQVTNLSQALDTFKDSGFWVAGAAEDAEQTVWEAPLEGKIVLVMGSEGQGLARLTREKCDFLVKLPQSGRIGSLNVAQATTAIAYEWVRRSRS